MNYLSEGFGSTALKTILDIKNRFSKISDKKNKGASYMGGSISQYSKDLVMTFPMLCDDTLPIETASMLSRANERYMITLFQMLFASEQLHGSSGLDVIKKIHKNIKTNMSLDDYIDTMETISGDIKDFVGEAAEINRARRVLTESLKNKQYKRYPENSFSEKSLNEYRCTNLAGRMLVTEAPEDVNDNFNRAARFIDGDNRIRNINPDTFRRSVSDIANAYERDAQNTRSNAILRRKNSIAAQGNRLKARELQMKGDQFAQDLALKQQQYELSKDKFKFDQDVAGRRDMESDIAFMQKQLVDSEVKKANELAPSLMVVKYVAPSSEDKLVTVEKPFICGVKSRLIPTEAHDIIERLIAKNKTKISFLNLIRATTGEIGFIKDFLFCIDQSKIDAKNAVKKGPAARIWKTLEFRATRNQKNSLKKAGNDASAITVLVINKETVNYMKKEFDFNLEDMKNTRMIMDSYNLLGIMICDESLEIVKSIYAGNDSYESQAYSYLEKESNDKSYKKVISLISQMNGR